MFDDKFGQLLKEGLSAVARRHNTTMSGVEAEISLRMDEAGFDLKQYTFAGWRRGYIPKEPGQIELLAKYCVSRGSMPLDWTREFLLRARYPLYETLLRKLFPSQQSVSRQVSTSEEQDHAGSRQPFGIYNSIVSPPYHNLPHPDYINFIGRHEELSWLKEKLAPQDRAWQIVLTGIGGVGKSALALFVAHYYCEHYNDLPPNERFEGIVWISAKEDILTVQGRKKKALSALSLRTLQDIYTAIAYTLGRDDITRALPEEQDRLIQKVLSMQRTLLVIDNLESINDERVRVFLYDLPPSTKCLITSREWVVDVAAMRRLEGFPFVEAEKMIIDEATSRGVRLNGMQRDQLFKRTSGLALPIKLGMARIASGETFEQVVRWLGNAIGDLPDYCIKDQITAAFQRQGNAQTVLFTCSLFDSDRGISRDALGFIADVSLADRDEAITLLQRLSLLNRTEEDRFWLLPMVHRYVEAQFTEAQMDEKLTDRWLKWLLGFAQHCETSSVKQTGESEANGDQVKVINHGIDVEGGFERVQALGIEYANVLKAIRWCRENERWKPLLQLVEGIWPYPDLVGLLSELREILEAALQAARSIHDELREGKILRRLGKFFWLQEQYDKALSEYVEKAEEIALRYNDLLELGRARDIRIAVWHSQRRLQEAEQLAKKLLKMGEDINSVELKHLAAYRLSRTYYRQNKFDDALALLDRSEQWCKELGWSQRLVWIMYGRADIFIQQGKKDSAEELLRDILNMSTIQSEWGLIAYNTDAFARLFYSEEARVWSERLGWTKALGQMREAIERLYK
jgi:tetratricopeptide (TPR) repeat protein